MLTLIITHAVDREGRCFPPPNEDNQNRIEKTLGLLIDIESLKDVFV